MADEEQKGSALVRTEKEAQNALQRIVGKPKDEEVYWCMGCGFSEDQNDPSKVRFPKGITLKFEEDEIAALGGDLSQYTGPCPVCNFMTLVPMSQFTGHTIDGMAMENRKGEYKEQAKAFVDVVKSEIAGGSLFDGGMQEPSEPAPSGPRPPGQHDDLPDADDVDDAGLTPRR